MAEPAKYMFDQEFDAPHKIVGTGDRTRPVAYSRAEIEAIRAEAYSQGFNQGRTEADGEQQRAIADALSSIAAAVPQITGKLEAERARLETEATTLAVTLARKLAPALMARTPLAEFEALIGEVLTHLADQPHVAVRINDELIEEIRAHADTIAAEKGFTGKLILLGEPGMAKTDCRIEWADGGVVRDAGTLSQEIDAIIERHLGQDEPMLSAPQPPETEAPGAMENEDE